jgi:hypothetical protein
MPYLSSFPRMVLEPGDKFIPRVISKTIVGQYAPPKPLMTRASKVASLGSCFANEIYKVLKARNMQAEHIFMDETWNSAFALSTFFEWIINNAPIPPHFADTTGIDNHQIQEVRQRLSTAEVFILTFGLSLCTYDEVGNLYITKTSADEGADASTKKVMRQTTVEENEAAILHCIKLLRTLCPNAAIVLTLSPVPLIGSISHNASVPSNMISKSVLRIALDKVMWRRVDGVYYWPSYEIVNWYGNHVERAYGDDDRDARHVRQKVVDTIADQFLAHYLQPEERAT